MDMYILVMYVPPVLKQLISDSIVLHYLRIDYIASPIIVSK